MSIPFIDLKAQYKGIEDKVRARIDAVFEHGAFILGPEVRELEEKLCEYTGSKYAVTCSSGTDALVMALMAWDVGPGDAVFTTPFTFFASAEVPAMLGATPIFVDIDPVTFNIDVNALEKAIEALEKKDPSIYPLPEGYENLTGRAVIPVDLYGQAADYDELLPLCAKHGLKVLEDAAQSFGGEYKGRKCCTFGDAAGTSFFPAKPLGAYGDAGAVFTNDEDLYNTFISIRMHGMGGERYEHMRLGINGRCDSLQAAMLLPKLEIFPQEIEARQQVAKWYTQGLAGAVETPVIKDNNLSAWAQYTVMSDRRDEIRAALGEQSIPTAVHYPKPVHEQPVFKYLGYKPGDLPVAERAATRVFSLPMHPYMDEETAGVIIDAIKKA